METKRLTVWAGRTMVAIGVLHSLVYLPNPYWGDWVSGSAWRGGELSDEAHIVFWALPGGFVPVLILFGLLVSRLGKRGEVLPAYVGWALGAWFVVGLWFLGPSGFISGLIPAGLLIAESFRHRRQTSAVRTDHDAKQSNAR